MFVKITNGQVDQYPYTVGDLRRDNPKTSFPKIISEGTMAAFGMYPVSYEESPEYNPLTHRLEHSDIPVLKNNKWVITKTVVELTQSQIEDKNHSVSKEVRKQRDRLLSETDWMALSDTSLSPEWASYRQALRDITAQEGFPHSITWPVKP